MRPPDGRGRATSSLIRSVPQRIATVPTTSTTSSGQARRTTSHTATAAEADTTTAPDPSKVIAFASDVSHPVADLLDEVGGGRVARWSARAVADDERVGDQT